MQCVNHPEVAPTALCTRCDAMLCGECIEERRGKKFCASCAAYLDQRDQSRQIPPAAVAAAQAQAGEVYQGAPAGQASVAPPQAQAFAQPLAPPYPPAEPAAPAAAPGQVFQGSGGQPEAFQPEASQPGAIQPAPPPPGAAPSTAGHPGAGQVYQEQTPGAAPQGDVYQGPGDVYQGPDDVYQGPGDVYQGPDAAHQGAAPIPAAAGSVQPSPGAIPDEANLVRAAIFGVVATIVSTGGWYLLAAASGRQRISTVILVGFLIGFFTSWGAGRRGDTQVVALSVGLFIFSMISGQFLINNHLHKQLYEYLTSEYEETADIEDDGDYTAEEARVLIGFSEEEWDEMSASQQNFWIASLEAEYEEAIEEGWDPDEEVDDEVVEMSPSLPIGEFLTHLPSYFGIWGLICLVFGGIQAYKFPAGFDE